MSSLRIVPYSSDSFEPWNNFLPTTNNGLFIHNRNYMDYHADRFTDASLMIYRHQMLVGLFPATKRGGIITSHAGLTYGGLLLPPSRGHIIRDIITEISNYYAGYTIQWKCVPSIFHKYPTEAERYWLTQLGHAVSDEKLSPYILRMDTDSTVPSYMHPNKQRDLRVANRYPLDYITGEMRDLGEFWGILEWTLAEHHKLTPTHTLAEMHLLRSRFPRNIQLRIVKHAGRTVAGAILYNYGRVVHTQYLATNNEGRQLGALNWLIAEYYDRERPYILNFGHSHERDGTLNWGLHDWKTRFGCAEIILYTYQKGAQHDNIGTIATETNNSE